MPCAQRLLSACRDTSPPPAGPGAGGSSAEAEAPPAGLPASRWVLPAEGGARGACPPGSVFDIPRHAVESYRLASLLRERGATAAWLPLSGPEWREPAAPAAHPSPPAAAIAAE